MACRIDTAHAVKNIETSLVRFFCLSVAVVVMRRVARHIVMR